MFRNHEGGIAQVIDGVRDKAISDTVYRLMYAAMARLNIALGSHGFQHYLGFYCLGFAMVTLPGSGVANAKNSAFV